MTISTSDLLIISPVHATETLKNLHDVLHGGAFVSRSLCHVHTYTENRNVHVLAISTRPADGINYRASRSNSLGFCGPCIRQVAPNDLDLDLD